MQRRRPRRRSVAKMDIVAEADAAGCRARDEVLARGGLESVVCAFHIGYDPASAEPFRFYVDQQESTTWTPGATCMSYRNCVDTTCTAWISRTRVYHPIGRPLSCLAVTYKDGDNTVHCELRDLASVLAADRRGILRRSTFMCR